MSNRPHQGRTAWRVALLLSVGALTLSSCTTSSVSPPHVTGVPSIGISVPLRVSACTQSGSCVALGTTGSNLTPATVGQYRETNGAWSSLVVPNTPSSQLTSVACFTTTCLFGGVQPTGNLLWNYNASSQSVAALHGPTGGIGIKALSCFDATYCVAIISAGVDAVSRLSSSSDQGATWSKEIPLNWTQGDSVDAVACTSPITCVVSATTPQNTTVIETTSDGVTWTQQKSPPTWTSAWSFTCVGRACVGLASSSSATYLIRSNSFAKKWHTTPLSGRASALACVRLSSCVAVGETKSSNPWLAIIKGTSQNVASLRYVPSPLEDVACSTSLCTANAVSTVLTIRP